MLSLNIGKVISIVKWGQIAKENFITTSVSNECVILMLNVHIYNKRETFYLMLDKIKIIIKL